MTKWYFFTGRSELGSGDRLAAPGAGQERSHAAWRSFFLKTMLPMQRGARSREKSTSTSTSTSIKHNINEIKETKKGNKKTKKDPYIRNYATPDRPPPAAVMLYGLAWLRLRAELPSRRCIAMHVEVEASSHPFK